MHLIPTRGKFSSCPLDGIRDADRQELAVLVNKRESEIKKKEEFFEKKKISIMYYICPKSLLGRLLKAMSRVFPEFNCLRAKTFVC